MADTKIKLTVAPTICSQTGKISAGILLSALCLNVNAVGLTDNQSAVQNVLTNCYNQNFNQDISFTNAQVGVCGAGAFGSRGNAALLQNLTPDQVFGMGYQSTRVTGGKVTQPYDYFRLKNKKLNGGGAGDEDFSRLSFWTKTDNDFGSLDTTANSTGYKFDNHNFVFGADYRLHDNWVAGGSFSYQNSNATFNAGRGATTTNNYTGSIYTTYNITDALHVEATASYGGFNYNTSRNIDLTSLGLGSSVATASPTGSQYAFSWGGGYDFNYQGFTLAPYLRGDYLNMNINGYSESGSIAAMQFANQTIESMVSTLGIQTAYTFSVPWGVLIPQLRGEWHHQYLDGQRQVQASFNSFPSQTFLLTGNAPSSDYYTFGAEVSSVLPGGVAAFLAYETLQGYSTVNSNKLMLGARLEF